MVKIQDVADRAGVSTASVSRVLSGKENVSQEMRERVMVAVEDLDYQPNLVARSLRSQQSNTVGLIVSDIRNPFFTDVSRAVEDMVHQAGYALFLCNTDEDPSKEALYLDQMEAQNVAGIIYSPTRHSANTFNDLDISVPTVVIDRAVRSSDVDQVLIDNVDAAYRLTEHLIQNGYRRIAGLFGEASVTGRERRQGYEEALQAHDLVPPDGMVRHIPPKIEAGRETASEILRRDDLPDAIITSNSLLTVGALMAIRERELSVPDQIGLVGFDETTWGALVEPAVTIIAQPTYEIGNTAADLLLQRVARPERPTRKVILQGELVVRGSSVPRQAT
ncbi:MAG: LacI family DNA-binding transcriptional regulator [Anaerolineae bacterium]|nr:LacI family DNA-binding transcriptional regulator [Anaerolineae bacterium]